MLQILQLHGVAPQALELSLYNAAGATPAALQALQTLRAAGLTLSLQQFGAQNLPFELLRALPLQHLGLDASIVQGLGGAVGDPLVTGIAQSAVLLARSLGAKVFAEEVSREAQVRTLQALGCFSAQGPFFGPRLEGPEATEHLRRAKPGPHKVVRTSF